MSTHDTLTVSQLTEQIKAVLEDTFINVFVEGEIGQINAHRSGHVYFSIKDEDARIDAVIWRSTVARLTYRPSAGEHVIAMGRLSVYAPHGSYKLVVTRLEPAGIGRLQAAFEATKKRLLTEGIFDASNKQAIPFLPKGVGVITSPTGAARRDIESVLHRRAPQVPIYLYPANVQGPRSVRDLIDGLNRLDSHANVDTIIIGRGGGSLEDLWSFNDEELARAIYRCKTPIISAVGHETDTTISDLVADLRAPTPSAAAELAVPSRDDLLFTITELDERIALAMERQVSRLLMTLQGVSARLRRGVEIGHRELKLNAMVGHLERLNGRRVFNSQQSLKALVSNLSSHHPERRLTMQSKTLGRLIKKMQTQFQDDFVRRQLVFGRCIERLDALSPLGVLARGYSLTTTGERVLMSTEQVEVGDLIRVRLKDGALDATVSEIKD